MNFVDVISRRVGAVAAVLVVGASATSAVAQEDRAPDVDNLEVTMRLLPEGATRPERATRPAVRAATLPTRPAEGLATRPPRSARANGSSRIAHAMPEKTRPAGAWIGPHGRSPTDPTFRSVPSPVAGDRSGLDTRTRPPSRSDETRLSVTSLR